MARRECVTRRVPRLIRLRTTHFGCRFNMQPIITCTDGCVRPQALMLHKLCISRPITMGVKQCRTQKHVNATQINCRFSKLVFFVPKYTFSQRRSARPYRCETKRPSEANHHRAQSQFSGKHLNRMKNVWKKYPIWQKQVKRLWCE